MSEYNENHHPFAVHGETITLREVAAEKVVSAAAHAGNALVHFTGVAIDYIKAQSHQLRH